MKDEFIYLLLSSDKKILGIYKTPQEALELKNESFVRTDYKDGDIYRVPFGYFDTWWHEQKLIEVEPVEYSVYMYWDNKEFSGTLEKLEEVLPEVVDGGNGYYDRELMQVYEFGKGVAKLKPKTFKFTDESLNKKAKHEKFQRKNRRSTKH